MGTNILQIARNVESAAPRYTGPLKAAILDWSGTTVDRYVIAPAVVFVNVFKKHGVPISMKEAREPMGLRKDLHIKALTELPEIRQRWKNTYGRDPDQTDVDNMFRDFVPMQLDCLRQYTGIIPGTVEAVNELRSKHKLKIGITTGFVRSMVDILLEESKKQGFEPDAAVAGDEVENGARPRPFMVYKNMDVLDAHPRESVIKVDDTVSGVGEALEAGCWGVGVSRYSNYMDIDNYEHENNLSQAEMEDRAQKSREKLIKTGVHYVIDSIVDLPACVEDVNNRLAKGERP